MRVVGDTYEQLIVENSLWTAAILGLGSAVFGLISGVAVVSFLYEGENFLAFCFGCAAIVGMCFTYTFARHSCLIFNRNTQTVNIRTRTLRGQSSVTYPLSDIQEAILQHSSFEGDVISRVALSIKGESTKDNPLIPFFSNIGNHRAVADSINRWLASTPR